MAPYYIGIGGVARSGKDSFARSLKSVIKLKHPDKVISIISLATPLKFDCQDFLKSKLNIDVFSNDSNEKSIFREMLVWYGKVKRQQSAGTYWTHLLDKAVEYSNIDICIVPDIRYQQYEKDEVFWLKNKKPNSFIHLRRRLQNGEFQPPANMDEKINDNIILDFADKKLIIESFSNYDFEHGFRSLAEEIYESEIKNKINNNYVQ
jgi:hypothetical protein